MKITLTRKKKENTVTGQSGLDQRPHDYSEQMQTLAIEMAIAGGQVLKDLWGFDDRGIAIWMDAMLTVAKTNRQTMLSKVVEAIEENG